ncbi:M15 family metallopeptidase [Actinoplanes sp. L3-i22]|uniref:M15 family metallopeptidase n=1 Tax=Actinoplanes sp. L3-i22 TaxID=2836373 RepID=UPI001C75D779|nr:M15 family metallopeptidase [Actinoplanes sp. L3-i22]BCY09897.1 hypothetical protein L3i22_049850 [Actinoplanes sp. L3-i22]
MPGDAARGGLRVRQLEGGARPAKAFTSREDVRPGMIRHGDQVWRAFTAHGFTWGGDWTSLKDHQHFETPV